MNEGILDGLSQDPDDRSRFNKSGRPGSCMPGGWHQLLSTAVNPTNTVCNMVANQIAYCPFILDFDVPMVDAVTFGFGTNLSASGSFRLAIATAGKYNRPDRWLTTFGDRTVTAAAQYTPYGMSLDVDLRAGEMYWGALWCSAVADLWGVFGATAGGVTFGVPQYGSSRFVESVTFGSWPARPFAGGTFAYNDQNGTNIAPSLFVKLP